MTLDLAAIEERAKAILDCRIRVLAPDEQLSGNVGGLARDVLALVEEVLALEELEQASKVLLAEIWPSKNAHHYSAAVNRFKRAVDVLTCPHDNAERVGHAPSGDPIYHCFDCDQHFAVLAAGDA